MAEREWLGVGLMHSGTAYLARLLHQFGMDVRHGEPGKKGVVNWELAPPPKQWPKLYMKIHARRAARFKYRNRIYIMRDPVRNLESLLNSLTLDVGQNKRGGLVKSFERMCPLGAVSTKSVAEYMLLWHRMILDQGRPTIITATEAAPRRLAKYFGKQPKKLPGTTVNSRRARLAKKMEYRTLTTQEVLSEFPDFQVLLDFHRKHS